MGALNRHSYARSVEHLHVITRTARERFSLFLKFLHDHLDDLVYVLERFLFGGPLGHCTQVAQCRAIGMKAALIGFYNYFESVRLHGVFEFTCSVDGWAGAVNTAARADRVVPRSRTHKPGSSERGGTVVMAPLAWIDVSSVTR
jgi:hypothetical protein